MHRSLGFAVPLRTVLVTAALPALIVIGGSVLVRLLAANCRRCCSCAPSPPHLAVYGLALLAAHRRGALLDERAQS